jgi:photosystem II stability/assembly factor-like uncharacterized protein
MTLSCKKESLSPVSIQTYDLNTSVSIRDIEVINDSCAFICGGMPGSSGLIWKSTDGGNTWTDILDMPERCLYDVEFIDPSNGFAGGDGLLLLQTHDGGLTWKNVYENETFDSWQEFIRPIRKIKYLNDYTIVAIGGDTYYKGLMCCSWNWGQNWSFTNFDNQLNDIEMHNSHQAWICGYGIMFSSSDSCRSLTTIDYREDDFTAIDFSDEINGIACGYNGGIYKTDDGGISWKEVIKSNGTFGTRRHFNNISFAGDQNAITVGNGGLILFSSDKGKSWQEVITETDADLLFVFAISPDEFYIGGSNGAFFKISI